MRFLPVLLAAFLITGVASAQHGNPGSGLVTFGVKGGLNYYSIKHDDNTNLDKRTGYNIGILGHIHFNSTWAVQPELVYSAQGAKGRNLVRIS